MYKNIQDMTNPKYMMNMKLTTADIKKEANAPCFLNNWRRQKIPMNSNRMPVMNNAVIRNAEEVGANCEDILNHGNPKIPPSIAPRKTTPLALYGSGFDCSGQSKSELGGVYGFRVVSIGVSQAA